MRVGAYIVGRWHEAVITALICVTAVSAAAQGFFPRGDSDCDAIVTAADVVGTLRALGGAGACDNDDCDRDRQITGADAACAARCLFGTCPVIPSGPFITQVVAESTPDIWPLALIRIVGTGFGPPDSLKQVTIGGFGAEVVGASRSDMLRVIVPMRVLPGPAEVVVIDGDIPGPPFTITVAPPQLLGSFNTFDDTLASLDVALDRVLALDLESVFGEQTAKLRDAFAAARDALAAQRQATNAAGLTVQQRAELDIAMDISGLPERVRQLIAQVDAALQPRGHHKRADTAAISGIVSLLGDTLAEAGGLLAGLGRLAAGGFYAGIAAITFLILELLNAPALPSPFIFEATYVNADGIPTDLPTNGGTVTVRAVGIVGPFGGALGVRRPSGLQPLTTSQLGGGMYQAVLPADDRFCGRFELVIGDATHNYSSPPLLLKVQPEVLAVFPEDELPIGSDLNLTARGVKGCANQAYAIFQNDTTQQRTYENVNVYSRGLVRTTTPDVRPGRYQLSLEVDATESTSPLYRRIVALSGLAALCTPSPLFLDPEMPAQAACSLMLRPETIMLPSGTHVQWLSTDDMVGSVSPDMPRSPFASTFYVADLPGTVDVTVTLSCMGATHVCDDDTGARHDFVSDPARVTVKDKTPPTVTITTVPPPGTEIEPGGTIMVTVKAVDNVSPAFIDLTAGGEPVGNGNQEFTCGAPTHDCETTFTVQVKQGGYTNRDIDISATVSDYSDNRTITEPVSFTARAAAPMITGVTNPVNAGAALTITGTGFGVMQGNSSVTIGGAGAAVTAWNDTSITATVPPTLSGRDIPVVVTVGGVASNTVTTTVLGTGDVQLTLIWHDTNDLDLHVTDPAGFEIFYSARGSPSGGMLDVDANSACHSVTAEPRENVFWRTGGAPSGKYTVRVEYFRGCTEPNVASSFAVTLLLDGVTSTLLEGSVGPGNTSASKEFTR